MARYCLGRRGWRDDLRAGLALARSADPLSYGSVLGWVYFAGIPFGVLAADDRTVREIEHALRIAERSSDDLGLVLTRMTLRTPDGQTVVAVGSGSPVTVTGEPLELLLFAFGRNAFRADFGGDDDIVAAVRAAKRGF